MDRTPQAWNLPAKLGQKVWGTWTNGPAETTNALVLKRSFFTYWYCMDEYGYVYACIWTDPNRLFLNMGWKRYGHGMRFYLWGLSKISLEFWYDKTPCASPLRALARVKISAYPIHRMQNCKDFCILQSKSYLDQPVIKKNGVSWTAKKNWRLKKKRRFKQKKAFHSIGDVFLEPRCPAAILALWIEICWRFLLKNTKTRRHNIPKVNTQKAGHPFGLLAV